MKPEILFSLLLTGINSCFAIADTLEEGFTNPPAEALPHTYWHWMNGNISSEGITTDLEAMARVGIGGAQIFNLGGNDGGIGVPAGPIDYLSPEWMKKIYHAAKEAERLGIKLGVQNSAGWSCCGGPWISPEISMQKAVWTETLISPNSPAEIQLTQPQTVQNYYRDIAVLAFPTPVNNSYRVKNLALKTGTDYKIRYGIQPEIENVPPEAIIPRDDIIDLTPQIDITGLLKWKPANGHWTILRIGCTTTGATNAPAAASGMGLECDKLNREALDVHWNKGIEPILNKLGKLAGNSFNSILVDSYEVGPANWTPHLREEFRKRRGYDMLLYLPALTGRIVASSEVTERFLWDYRRTIADLFADNFYGYLAEKCHQHGLLCSIEPYDGQYEYAAAGAKADINMGEFWIGWRGMDSTLKLAASIAHTNGKPIAGAEAFTADPQDGRWQNYPGSLKMLGDKAWCNGINRFIFHRYTHQPWLDRLPGMTMGQWGTHFDRTNTWWEQGKAWMKYIGRCQFMLQQGRFVADVLFFVGEAVPIGAVGDEELHKAGYDYDMCGTNLIDCLSVDKGMIRLPSGMRYRLLVLPDTRFMTPRLAACVRELVRAGATVVASRPEMSPSLEGYPNCDVTVRKNAKQIWGAPNQETVGERRFGHGRILWGHKPLEILLQMDVPADCIVVGEKASITYIHRIAGNNDIYFISHQDHSSRMVELFFRVRGRRPELWDPITGNIAFAGVWHVDSQGTYVTLPLSPAGSVFVVFRKPIHDDSAAIVRFQQKIPVCIEDILPRPVRKLEIIKASYGSYNCSGFTMLDVTEKLTRRIKKNRLVVVASNILPADFMPNVNKKLYVDYEYDGVANKIEIDADQELTLPKAGSQPGRLLRILRAGYGKLQEGKKWLADPNSIDVTVKTAAAIIDNTLNIHVTNDFTGKDPAYGAPKRMTVHYTLDGEPGQITVNEHSDLILPPKPWLPAAWMPEITVHDKITEFLAWDNGQYILSTSDGNQKTIHIDSLPQTMVLNQPWTVEFTHGRGAPAQIELPKLISWTQQQDPGIHYYSGTAIYRTIINIEPNFIHSADRIKLDLGEVCCLAEMIVNGHTLGVLWCNPYRSDITEAVQAGDNTLEIRVTNLWPNRLIGDEQFPDDCQWIGNQLAQWPDWLIKGGPRPVEQRLTFTTWKHWKKEDTPLHSGLLGPVYLKAGRINQILKH